MTMRKPNLPITRVFCACMVLLTSGGLWLPAAFGDGVIKHTITPSAGPGGTIDPDCATKVTPGSDLELTAATDPGYQVDAWSVDGSAVQAGGTSLTLADIQADHAVHVTFKLLEYNVTSSAGPNGTINPEGVTVVSHGNDLAFTATADPTYMVDEWTVDSAKVQSGGTDFTLTNVQADKAVEVTFKLIEYKITSSAGTGGTVSPEGDTYVTHGSDLELTATPDTGYQVDKWCVDGAEAQVGGATFTLSGVQAKHSVKVTFKLLEFDVTSAAGPNGTVSPDGVTVVTYGSDLELTATPDTGYQVDKWYVDGVEAQAGGDTFKLMDVKADQAVDVTFRLLEFEITSMAEANGAVIPDGVTVVTYGSDLELMAIPDTGYQVDNWCVDGAEAQVGGDAFTLADIQADHSVKVTFRLLEFEITTSADPNGAIEPNGVTVVTYGSDLEIAAIPNTGYQVDKWTVDGNDVQTGGNIFTLTDIKADHTVGVTFRLLEFDITGVAGDNGAIDPNGVTTVTYGSDLEFTATPEGDYLVRIWSVDGVQVQIGGASYTLTDIKADHTVEVSFSLLFYVITPVAGPNGSIDPAGPVTAEPNDSLNFWATPNEEYRTRAWFVDGGFVQREGASFTLGNIQSDHTVSVAFAQIMYTVDATAGPGGSVSPESIDVHAGGNHAFTATADVGFEVDTWSLDGLPEQTGGLTFLVGSVHAGRTVHVTFKRLLAYSLGAYEFEDEKQNEAGIVHNGSDPDQPLVSIEQGCPGSNPDNSVMVLRCLADAEGQISNGCAKGAFLKTDTDEILISFKYLFASSTAELVVRVSNSPQLQAQNSVEVARVPAPPFDLPGSEGSGRFGVFEKMVWTGGLDLTKGLYVELELIDETDGGSVCIDSWSAQVRCYGVCLDVNRDGSVDEADFLRVLAAYGLTAEGETACLEGAFSTDGYIDLYDVAAWDWAMNSDQRLSGYCGLALAGDGVVSSTAPGPAGTSTLAILADVPSALSDLLIVGKRGSAGATDKLKDSLYLFSTAGESAGTFEAASSRCNIRLVKGPDGQIYVLNSEAGLVRLDATDTVVVPAGQIGLAADPRNGSAATVYVGIQAEGSDSVGRPILDVALDADHVYVVPVVVAPDGGEAYTAAARLKLTPDADSPYELVELYDDAPLPNDNQQRNSLREIEIDSAGNVYVLNVNGLNESDILLRYMPDGTVERLDLGRPDGGSYVPAPVAIHVSQTSGALYLASAIDNGAGPDSSVICKLSTQGGLALEKSVTVDGVQHVTGITEDPATGALWIAGFNIPDVPQDPDATQPAFYYPQLASISVVDDSVQVIPLYDPASHDLAMPMSVLWTGVVEQAPGL